MSRWVALLRGVNVGRSNRLPMAGLRTTAADLGWSDVATYIQSGNVVFTATGDETTFAACLSAAVRERHGLTVGVVVRPAAEVARIAEAHPALGGDIDPKFLQVMLLDREPTAADAGAVASDAFEPDTWALDGREVYATYPAGSGRSKLTIEVFERAWGVTATGRNVNTMRKLAALV